MSKAVKVILLIISIGFAIYFGIALVNSINDVFEADKERATAEKELEDAKRELREAERELQQALEEATSS